MSPMASAFDSVTIETLTIKVSMSKETMELFTIPIPAFQQEFIIEDQTKARTLDNPLEESLRNYIVWGRTYTQTNEVLPSS